MTEQKDITYGFQSAAEEQFPILVQLALMHYICNSRCVKCPVGLLKRGLIEPVGEYSPDKRRFFPFDIFPKIADEIGRHPLSILRFHGRGEPLMHPNYVGMIAYAKKAGISTVTSFTNVVLLDTKMAEAILDAGLDLLELSVDAYTEQLYYEFRGTNYFRRVINNAENFIKLRNRRGDQCRTRVVVSAVDCPEFQAEKADFRKFWTERADQVIFRPYHTYGGRLDPIQNSCQSEPVPCAQLWTRLSINPWGQVNACFNDWADEELVGDLNQPDMTIAKIWQGEKFEAIRSASLKGASILKCCGTCLATKESWSASYQLLIEKLRSAKPNRNL